MTTLIDEKIKFKKNNKTDYGGKIMRKIVSIFIVSVIIFSALSINSQAVLRLKKGTASYGTPKVDGVMDECYNNSSELSIEFMASFNNNATEADLPNMAKGKARLCWDENAMYIFLQVVDKTPVKTALTDISTDGMELFFDFDNINSTDPSPDGRVGNYGANGAMLKTAAYARTVGTPEYEIFWVDNFSDFNDWLSTLSAKENETSCVITSDGYIIERKIPLNDAVKKMVKPGFTHFRV